MSATVVERVRSSSESADTTVCAETMKFQSIIFLISHFFGVYNDTKNVKIHQSLKLKVTFSNVLFCTIDRTKPKYIGHNIGQTKPREWGSIISKMHFKYKT